MSWSNRAIVSPAVTAADYEGYFISEVTCCFKVQTSYVVLQNRCITIYSSQSQFRKQAIPSNIVNVSELNVLVEDRCILLRHKKGQQIELIALNDRDSHLLKKKINVVLLQDWLDRYKHIDKTALIQQAQDSLRF